MSKSDPTFPIVVILRIGGVMLMTAFFAILLPTDTMDSTHRWLGMGELPRAPITEYLTRSLSAFYGFHGALLWLVSTNVVRFRPIVVYLGWMNVGFGAMLLAIDLTAPLPLMWTLSEGPPLMAVGIALLVLVRRIERA